MEMPPICHRLRDPREKLKAFRILNNLKNSVLCCFVQAYRILKIELSTNGACGDSMRIGAEIGGFSGKLGHSSIYLTPICHPNIRKVVESLKKS